MLKISEFGGLSRLGELRHIYSGKNILLVTGKDSFATSGAKRNIDNQLQAETVFQFSDFSANPKLEDAVNGAEFARSAHVGVIIAVGGGSVIDTAKLIKAFYLSEGNEIDLATGRTDVTDPSIPLLAIPTTAGSGSEATHFAVVYVGSHKYSLAAQCLLPEAVILDGALIISGNRYQKACSALDAMAQAIESAWATGSTIESFKYSTTALELGWGIFHDFIKPNCSEKNAQKMLEAANFSGQAINISKTTAAHAWSYAFTSSYDIPHGHAVWLTLPEIFEAHIVATDHDITDTRGSSHLKNTMDKLSKTLGLNQLVGSTEQLQVFLKDAGIEYRMEQVGVDNLTKRSDISNQINPERMRNNPVNLEPFKSKIFSLPQSK